MSAFCSSRRAAAQAIAELGCLERIFAAAENSQRFFSTSRATKSVLKLTDSHFERTCDWSALSRSFQFPVIQNLHVKQSKPLHDRLRGVTIQHHLQGVFLELISIASTRIFRLRYSFLLSPIQGPFCGSE